MRAAALALVVLLAGCQDEPRPRAPDAPAADAPAQPAQALMPAVALPTLDGDTLELSSLRGRYVLVNFWATWCPPCRAETPDLIALHRAFEPRGLSVVGISVDLEGPDVVRAFADEYGIPYPILLGGESATEAFGGAFGLPTSFLLNPDGEVVGRFPGVFPAEAMREEFEALLPAG